jgi:hypothetical protein
MSEYWLLRRLNGTVDTVTWGLPQAVWKARDGKWVDGLASLSSEALLALGWQRLAAATLSEADVAVVMPLVYTSVIARIREKRWLVETGGMDVGGMNVMTDDRSKTLITGAYMGAKDEVAESFDFQVASGWVTITAEQAIAVGLALFALVQGCFSACKTHEEAVALLRDAQDPKAVAAYDFTSGWPA